MAKTEADCAADILTTISTGLLSMAAKSAARVSALEDELTIEKDRSTQLAARVADLERQVRA